MFVDPVSANVDFQPSGKTALVGRSSIEIFPALDAALLSNVSCAVRF